MFFQLRVRGISSILAKRPQRAADLDLGRNHPDNSETLRQLALKAVT
jgi:hypothetical protein